MKTPAAEAAMQCAILVNDTLSDYLEAHNYAFRSQATPWSMIRSLFGGGPDFKDLCTRAVTCDEGLSFVQERVLDVFSSHVATMSPTEQDFFGAMIPYLSALKQTTALLRKRQEMLLAKRNGQPVTLAEYRQVEEDYQHSVQNYMSLAGNIQLRSELLL